jgi:hypothetical protein
MTFDDLPLFEAIYDLRREMEMTDQSPGSDLWTTDEDKRLELTQRLFRKLVANVDQKLIDAWMRFRKGSDVDGRKKLELTIEVARAHGRQCFYADRGLGECSSDIDLDRIVPGSRGGKYMVENCVIACGRHNRARGDKNIEELLVGETRDAAG